MSKLKTGDYTLFDYLQEQHDLILTESELAEVMYHAKKELFDDNFKMSADLTKADWERKKLQQQNQELRELIKSAIPTNWLDPLLTGKDKVLPDGYKYTPADIENLLNAIRKQVGEKLEALTKEK